MPDNDDEALHPARVLPADCFDAWRKWIGKESGKGWIGVFNRTDQLKRVTLSKAFLDLTKDSALTNIRRGRKQHKLTSASAIEIDINPDGVLFLRYE